ncbi:MAG: ATP-dependent helicase [Lachnospiraceae bacterium]|nr:ATP-dependent helicase [Lachnospiraceae bacterium]
MPELKINPIQKKAIEFSSGAMQVLAGPGSGKTFVITQRIRNLIENCDVDPATILVITFTKAAAMEMQQRFYKLMEGERPPVNFGTFHAIFYHILRQSGKYRNFTLIKETEKRKLLMQILNLPQSQVFINDEKIDNLIRYISIIKNEGGNIDACVQDTFEKDELLKIYTEYNEFLDEFQKLDFDDMGLLCLKLFEENSDILKEWQERYKYIMVDEFQDINPMQYQIVKNIAGERANLFIVGDDDQSIYGFRGARPDIMRQFMEDYKDATQLLLNVNYRCHEDIVQKSINVININKNRYVKEISASHTDGSGVIIKQYPDQETEYEALINELMKINSYAEFKNTENLVLKDSNNTLIKNDSNMDIKDSGINELLSNIAIIYRTNHECSLLAEKLLINHIPFTMKEPLKSQYDHFVIKDILAYMEFAAGNRSRELFHLFMNRPLRYLRKACARQPQIELKELLDYYKDNSLMQGTASKLFSDIERIKTLRPYLAINYIRKVIGYDIYLKDNYDKDSVDKFIQIADDFQKLSKQYDSFKDLNDYISQCRELLENKQNENTDDETGVRLMTMHASKGLEFDTVIIPDVNEKKIPSKQSDTPEAIEEERRMFYVAMTRAKKNLYILYCSQKEGKDMPSRFLEPILK